MQFTEHVSFFQRKLFSRGQLTLARIARETRKMVNTASRASNPVICVNTSSAPCAFGAKLSAKVKSKPF